MKNLVEKLPDQQPALRVMAMPPDTNQYGDVFGGWIMSQVDLAGSPSLRVSQTVELLRLP